MSTGLATDLAVGVPLIGGALCFLVAAVAVIRVGDATTRVNVLSVASGPGMALFIVAVYVHVVTTSGVRWIASVEAVVAVGACAVVTAVASIVLARSVRLSGARSDPRTLYDDLAADTEADPAEDTGNP